MPVLPVWGYHEEQDNASLSSIHGVEQWSSPSGILEPLGEISKLHMLRYLPGVSIPLSKVTSRHRYIYLFIKDLIYLFLESGEGRKKERKRNIDAWERNIHRLPLTHPQLRACTATQACALTGN